ncbi:Ger(x)C family spore germination protein [Bacillus sp. P14.5]|uniref:Ger(x)C family spore germination protein n=1 Tax=Bacillus sp. P14.5 TaxID=1983400 RepID=UPI000DE95564|nr:Ger(x)C family spore germination protein [Bacillus sp. P14.5]
MKRACELFSLPLMILLLTGCWDQTLLKNTRLILAASFDSSSEERILAGVTTPIVSTAGSVQNSKESVELLMSEGLSPRDARLEIDNKTSQKLDASKLLILTIGSELAKRDIYSVLDVFYRDPKSALSSKIAVVDGEAIDVLNNSLDSNLRAGNLLTDLLQSAENNTTVSVEDIQTICAEMFDEGVDFMVPFLTLLPEKEIKVDGMAMFHDKSFTGKTLEVEESRLFLLLKDKVGKTVPFSYKIRFHEKETFVSFKVKSHKTDLKVVPSSNGIKVPVTLKVEVSIQEFPEDTLMKKSTIDELTKLLQKRLEEDSRKVLEKLHEANCDGLGIGNRVQAFYPEVWKKRTGMKSIEILSFSRRSR